MISISFNVTKDDIVALACHYYARSSTVRSARLMGQLTVTTVLLAGGFIIISKESDIRPVGIILLLCAGLAAMLYPGWYRSSLRQSAKKFVTESSYEKAFGNYTLALSEQGLASTSPVSEGKYSWEAINGVSLTPEYLFIFVAGPQGWPIPRAQLPDTTIQEVKAFAEAHISKRSGSSGASQGPPSGS